MQRQQLGFVKSVKRSYLASVLAIRSVVHSSLWALCLLAASLSTAHAQTSQTANEENPQAPNATPTSSVPPSTKPSLPTDASGAPEAPASKPSESAQLADALAATTALQAKLNTLIATETTLKTVAKTQEADDPDHGVNQYLAARCMTALCFDDKSRWLGVEPLIELPVGKSFATGSGSLINYVNNHDIKVDLAAGFRVWMFRDLLSVSLYLSIPLPGSGIRLVGSSFTYPAASIRRPYPGFAFGLLYDIIWVGIDHDELRNGDSIDSSAYNAEYPANARVSSCTTITVALQLVTAARALFGALAKKAPK
jgi:hypothetical protein